MPVAIQGQPLDLNVNFYDESGTTLTDPSSITFQIVLLGAATPPVIVGPLNASQVVRNSSGNYTYLWNIPNNATIGTYQVQWFGTINNAVIPIIENIEIVAASAEEPVVTATQLSTDTHILVFLDHIALKFDYTPKAATVYSGNYELYQFEGTASTAIVNPFNSIQTRDYNSISRVLELYFTDALRPSTMYQLDVSGIINAAGQSMPEVSYPFVTLPNEQPNITPIDTPIYVEDHSISEAAFINLDNITEVNPNFYITGTDPDMNQVFLDPNYNSGRIAIKFSTAPAGNYLNNDYFKVQYKVLNRGFNRWIDVNNVIISLDGSRPWVYLDMPSLDATPVYGVSSSVYYNPQTKYRIKISKDVGS